MSMTLLTITIDVKDVAGKTGGAIDNVEEANAKPNHFLVFVCFMNKINDLYLALY